jgi:hypothetical protein
LRAGYKDRTRIVHAILADRIGQRDPGNKPEMNDRVPFVYIIPKGKVLLQGERVEDPKYVLDNNLELDYLFYITNQIMKPIQQLFALVIEKIWIIQNKHPKLLKFKKDVELLKKKYEDIVEKYEEVLEVLASKNDIITTHSISNSNNPTNSNNANNSNNTNNGSINSNNVNQKNSNNNITSVVVKINSSLTNKEILIYCDNHYNVTHLINV